MSSVEPGELTS